MLRGGERLRIHVVEPGQTVYGIARQYGAAAEDLLRYNGLSADDRLAVGQSLLILYPSETVTAQEGDTLFSLARRYGLSVWDLQQKNPQLGGGTVLRAGEKLTVALEEQGTRQTVVSGYAYPFAQEAVLRGILPYATDLVPFSYGIAEDGGLLSLNDERLVRLAREYGARPVLHLSTVTEEGRFSTERAAAVLASPQKQQTLASDIVRRMREMGYEGLDVDFEYVGGENAAAYSAFVGYLRQRVNAEGWELTVALAPKVSADQPGVLYEGHDYRALAENADRVLLMTYEWGYTYGPPMAVAPVPSVRRVLDYAVTEMAPEKILMGFPNYGYDWALPYEAGTTRAQSISNEYAVRLAVRVGAEIQFDESARCPYFHYTAEDGVVHEVWFEDARSCLAKYNLVTEYGFAGLGFWNFMRPFTVGFSLLTQMFRAAKE